MGVPKKGKSSKSKAIKEIKKRENEWPPKAISHSFKVHKTKKKKKSTLALPMTVQDLQTYGNSERKAFIIYKMDDMNLRCIPSRSYVAFLFEKSQHFNKTTINGFILTHLTSILKITLCFNSESDN